MDSILNTRLTKGEVNINFLHEHSFYERENEHGHWIIPLLLRKKEGREKR